MRPRTVRVAFALVATIAIAVLAAHTAPFRGLAFRQLAAFLRTSQQIDLQATAFRYNLLTLSASLENVRVAAVAAPAEPFAGASRVDLTFGPGILLGNMDLRRVDLDSPQLTITRRADGSGNLPAGARQSGGGSPVLPALRATGLDVSVTFDGARIVVNDAAIDLQSPAPGRLSGTVQATHGLQVTVRGKTFELTSATSAVDVDGRVLTVRELAARRPGTSIRGAGTIDFAAQRPTADLTFSGQTEAVTWQTGDNPVRGGINVRGAMRGPLADPVVSFEVDSPSLARLDTRIDDVRGRGVLQGGVLRFEQFDARAGGGSVEATGVVALDGDDRSRVDVRWSGVRFSRLLPNVPSLDTIAGDGDATLEWQRDIATGAHLTARIATGLIAGGERTPVDIAATHAGEAWAITAAPRNTAGWTFAADAVVRLNTGGWRRAPVTGHVRLSADDAGALAMRARDFGLPTGSYDLDAVTGAVGLEATLGGTLGAVTAHGRATARALAGAGLPPVDVESSFTADAGRRQTTGTFVATAPDLSAARIPGAPDLTVGGSLAATGSWTGAFANPRLDARVTGRNLSAIAPGEQPINVAGGAFDATISGPYQAFGGEGRMSVETLDVSGRPLGPVIAELRLSDGLLSLDARAANLNTTAVGTIQVSSPFAFEGRADVAPISLARIAALAGSTLDASQMSGDVAGSMTARGTLDDLDAATGTLVTAPVTATVSGVPVILERGLRAEWNDGHLRVESVRARVGDLSLDLRGDLPARSTGGYLVADVDGDLSSLMPWVTRLDPAGEWTAAARAAGRVEVRRSAAGLAATGAVNATIDQIARGGRTMASGVDLTLALTGARAELRSLTATALGGAVRLTGGAPVGWINRWLPRGWHFETDASPGALGATGAFDIATAVEQFRPKTDRPVGGRVTLSADLVATAPSLAALSGTIQADQVALTVDQTTLTQTEPIRLRMADGRLTIESLSLEAPGAQLTGRGGIGLAGSITSDVHVDVTADLSALAAVLPGRARGRITGVLDLLGTPGDWRLGADLTLADASLLIPQPGFFLDNWSGRIRLTDDQVSVERVNGRINGGTLLIDGRLSLPAGVGAPSAAGVTFTASNILLNVPQGLHSELAADLKWLPADDGATITGTIAVASGRYTEPVTKVLRLVQSLADTTRGARGSMLPPVLRRSALDVTISLSTPLAIENSLGSVELTPDLRLVGTVAAPALSGRIAILDEGRVTLGGRVYRLRESELQFSPAAGLEPTLDVIGETRVGEYDVTMRIRGTPGQIETSYDSSPPLSERDLRSLLVTGSTQSGALDAGSEDFAVSAAASDILGFAGQFVGLDSVRLGTADLDLASRDVDASQRLTISKSFGRRFELIASDNLETGEFTWVLVWKPSAGYEVRAASIDGESQSLEFRQVLTFGPGSSNTVTGAARQQAGTAVVDTLRFTGQPGFAEAELAGALRLGPGRTFDVRAWIDDRLRLYGFYAKRGYHRVRIAPTRVPGPERNGRASWVLNYEVERGPLTVIVPAGDPLPSDALEEMYTAWRGVPIADIMVPEFERIARQAMQRRGYDRAAVRVTLTDDTTQLARAVVHLERGPRTTRQSVRWSGNALIANAQLDEIVETHRHDTLIDLEAVAWDIERLYAARGYLSTTIRFAPATFDGDVATVEGTVAEGPRAVLADLTIDGVSAERRQAAEAALGIAKGDTFLATTPVDAGKRLRAFYANLGYRDVRVTQAVEPGDEGRMALTLGVREGPLSVVDEVRVEGVESTNAGLVSKAITLQPGAAASQSGADATRRNLYGIGSFRRVDVRFEPQPLREGAAAQPVVFAIDAAETRRYQLRYGALVSTDRGVGGGDGDRAVGFGASVELRDRNFLGRAIQANAGLHYEGDLQTVSVLFSAPRFAGRGIRSNLYARERHEQASLETALLSSVERDLSFEQRWRPSPTTEVTWGYQFEYRLFELEDDAGTLDFAGYLAGPLTTFVIDRRDSPFDATRGWFHSSGMQVGVESLGSTLGYVRYLARQSVYQGVGPLTLAGSARFGVLKGYSGTAPLSTLDLFFLAGGTNTVRGYEESSLSAVTLSGFFLGGPSLLVLNGEVRFPVYRKIKGAVFVDAGNTFLSTRAIALNDMAVGSGIGLRIATPLAPIRLDAAYPATTRFGPRRWRFHLSIGQMF